MTDPVTEEYRQNELNREWLKNNDLASAGPGGVSPGVLTSADFLFTEDDASESYTATLDVPARTVVASVQVTPLAAPWDADAAVLTIGDVLNGADSYLGPADLTATSPDYAITAVDTGGPYNITAINQGTKTITIAGDHRECFFAGVSCTVAGSTGNDGTYTQASVAFSGGNTLVTVVQALPNPTADGTLAFSDSTVTVAGDHQAAFSGGGGAPVDIAGSSGNDGSYVLNTRGATLVGGNTLIHLDGTLPDDTPDGTITSASGLLLNAAYDPTNVGNNNHLNLAFVPGGSLYGLGNAAALGNTGNGIYYETDDTITASVSVVGPSNSPAGIILVKVVYFTAQTPTEPTLA